MNMINNINNRKCPLCNSSKSEILYIQKFADHFSHKLVCCDNCGFVYVGNTPPQEFYDKYYQEESKYEGVREHEAHDVATKKELTKVLKKINKNAKILDVGCSTGTLLSYLKTLGYNNLYGIDPAPKCKKFAKEKHKINIGTYSIDNYCPKTKYDFIIISQVLEHITDIVNSINKIYSWLKEDGIIFIGVPDTGEFYLDIDEPFGEFSTEHINFFTKSSLFYLMHNFSNEMIKSDKKVLFSIWRKSNQGKKSIIKYIKRSTRKLNHINETIDNLPNPVIVWGVGALTRRLLLSTSLKSKVKFFVDSNPNLIGKKIMGIPIFGINSLNQNKYSILISSYKFQNEIKRLITKNKYKNPIITLK